MKNQTNMFKSYKCGFQTKGFFKTKRKLFKLEKEKQIQRRDRVKKQALTDDDFLCPVSANGRHQYVD